MICIDVLDVLLVLLVFIIFFLVVTVMRSEPEKTKTRDKAVQ